MSLSDWSESHNNVVVKIYFEMLSKQQSGTVITKSDYRRRAERETGRSKGAVEYKFQNISAILDEQGMPWVQGYVPMKSYQQTLKDAVLTYLGSAKKGEGGDAMKTEFLKVCDFCRNYPTEIHGGLPTDDPRVADVKKHLAALVESIQTVCNKVSSVALKVQHAKGAGAFPRIPYIVILPPAIGRAHV
mgnify:CR=1 FL=1